MPVRQASKLPMPDPVVSIRRILMSYKADRDIDVQSGSKSPMLTRDVLRQTKHMTVTSKSDRKQKRVNATARTPTRAGQRKRLVAPKEGELEVQTKRARTAEEDEKNTHMTRSISSVNDLATVSPTSFPCSAASTPAATCPKCPVGPFTESLNTTNSANTCAAVERSTKNTEAGPSSTIISASPTSLPAFLIEAKPSQAPSPQSTVLSTPATQPSSQEPSSSNPPSAPACTSNSANHSCHYLEPDYMDTIRARVFNITSAELVRLGRAKLAALQTQLAAMIVQVLAAQHALGRLFQHQHRRNLLKLLHDDCDDEFDAGQSVASKEGKGRAISRTRLLVKHSLRLSEEQPSISDLLYRS